MRIEVLEGSEEPVIYPFNSPKLTIGSGENCDVTISASGISRKHLLITAEDDKFFVIDQGSTNGSFLNEERLVPGRKVEFTSFFPVRLGENVLISLLSDEEGMDDFSIPVPKEKTSPSIVPPKDHDNTTVINLKTLQKVKTETLVLERNKKREIRRRATPTKKPPEKPKQKVNYMGWLCFAIVAAAGYYNFYYSRPVQDEPIRKMGEVILPDNGQVAQPSIEAGPVVSNDLIVESDIPEKNYINGLLNSLKCTIEEEIYLCDIIPHLREGKFGVTQVGLSLHILLDGSRYFAEAGSRLGDKANLELIQKTAAYIFLMRMPELNLDILKDSRMIISLFRPTDTGDHSVDTIIAIKPSVFNREKHRLTENILQQAKRVGSPAFEFTKKIYIVR